MRRYIKGREYIESINRRAAPNINGVGNHSALIRAGGNIPGTPGTRHAIHQAPAPSVEPTGSTPSHSSPCPRCGGLLGVQALSHDEGGGRWVLELHCRICGKRWPMWETHGPFEDKPSRLVEAGRLGGIMTQLRRRERGEPKNGWR